MSKIYKNPPIIEAVCEVRSNTVDDFSPGLILDFKKEIRDFFPVAKKGKILINSSINSNKSNVKYEESFTEFDQYFSEDEKSFVKLENGKVSIHFVKPYISWSKFSPQINLVVDSYLKIFHPVNISRIGLRYINELNFPIKDFNFDEYFNVKISLPPLIVKNQKSIFIGIVSEQSDGKDAIKVQFGENQQKNSKILNERSYVLDFDYFLIIPHLSFTQAKDWINNAHTSMEEVFEGFISDKTRSLFNK